MNVFRPDDLPDLIVVEPSVYRDDRGYFLETWQAERYRRAGIDSSFVQDNSSRSQSGVLRGLHFQHPSGQGKLVRVGRGEVFDVAVDLRVGSPTFANWWGCNLSDEEHRQVWIPPGFGHGFVVLSPSADVHYKCTARYAPEHDRCLRWDDPRIGIHWPVSGPRLSDKDAGAPSLRELQDSGLLPQYET